MSTRRHKRRRLAPPEDDVIELSSSPPPAPDEEASNGAAETAPSPAEQAPPEDTDGEAFGKEREIWETFREEQYEVLEQLPLSLHRAFTLIQELDQQAQEHISNIPPAILKYVSLRRSIADAAKEREQQQELHRQEGAASTDALTNGLSTSPEAPETSTARANGRHINGMSVTPARTSATPALSSVKGRTPPVTSKSLADVVRSSNSTREILISLAQSAEELGRASNEKEYLAQHVYDLVDRYIRDLDRALKEQEASISLGLRPGTHPASITLPELVLPRANRSRVTTSPHPDELPEDDSLEPAPADAEEPPSSPSAVEDGDEDEEEPGPETEDGDGGREEETPDEHDSGGAEAAEDEIIIVDDQPPAVAPLQPELEAAPRRGRKRRKPARYIQEPSPERISAAARKATAAAAVAGTAPSGRGSRSLTLRIPAPVPPPVEDAAEQEDDAEDGKRWCYCYQQSYGEMVACDNDQCTREWFHLPCVGLTYVDPKKKWYCDDCKKLRKRAVARKRRR